MIWNHLPEKAIAAKKWLSLISVAAFLFAITQPGWAQAPYCTPTYSSGCIVGDDLNSLTLTGNAPTSFNDLNTGCSPGNYADKTNLPPVSMTVGQTYSGQINSNYPSSEYARFWIDFNNNNAFEASESVGTVGPFGTAMVNYTLNIPLTATPGLKRMRVRVNFASMTTDPCALQSYGEAHDYMVNIVPNLPPCAGKPEAGKIVGGPVCPNFNSILKLDSLNQATDLQIQWFYNVGSGWQAINPSNDSSITININQPTAYKAVVTCLLSSQSDTTDSVMINFREPYYCYCQGSQATANTGMDIGNVTISNAVGPVLNNGNGTPIYNNQSANRVYTAFYNLPFTPLHQDSSYNTSVQFITDGALFTQSKAFIYIDYNHDGIFDQNTELATIDTVDQLTQKALGNFVVPANALLGPTGMRVILAPLNFNGDPCTSYGTGETEDYVVEIRPPMCSGTPDAGIAVANDSISCIGYPVELIDSTYTQNRFNIERVWQTSPDQFVWGDIAASANKDSIHTLFPGLSYYRLRVICKATNDTAYSNVVRVQLAEAYECYCYNTANSKTADSSDIGSFTIGTYSWATTGPHILNPAAVRGRTSRTRPPIVLHQDSSYNIGVYAINRQQHADAKVTLFIDYNNSLTYDVPTELVWTGYTNVSNFFLTGNITIPSAVIMNAPTGMRLVLNDDLAWSGPSDNSCGTYTSGETEDFVVIFKGNPTSIANVANLSNLHIFPNPAKDFVSIRFDAQERVKQATVSITSVTGQLLDKQVYEVNNKSFSKNFSLRNLSAGMYMVNINVDGQNYTRKLTIQ